MTQGRPFWEKNISPVKYTERGYFCVKEPTNSKRETRKAATCNERGLSNRCGTVVAPGARTKSNSMKQVTVMFSDT